MIGIGIGMAARRGLERPDPTLLFRAPLRSSLVPTKGTGAAAFSRASAATFLGSNGLFQTAASGAARFDYAQIGNSTPGLLVEGQVTNSALWSQDLSNAVHALSNMTAVAASGTAPDGTNTATLLTATAGNATCLQSITLGSAAHDFSIYLKRSAGVGVVNITIDGGTTWAAKTLTATWTRFDVSKTAANPVVGIQIVTNGDAVLAWQEQCEPGTFPTSPIFTTNATATRAADALTYPAVGNLSLSAASISLWVNSLWSGSDTGANRILFDTGITTSQNRLLIVKTTAPALQFTLDDSASVNNNHIYALTGVNWPANAWNHVVCTHDAAGNVTMYLNGVIVLAEASFGGWSSFNALGSVIAIGGRFTDGTSPAFADFRDVRSYNRVLSAAEVAQLNGGGF